MCKLQRTRIFKKKTLKKITNIYHKNSLKFGQEYVWYILAKLETVILRSFCKQKGTLKFKKQPF